MTDRFSPEYIDFVTKSRAIQAAWQKRGVRVGDWAISPLSIPGGNPIGLITQSPEEQNDGSHGTVWESMDPETGDVWDAYWESKQICKNWFWLPTLSDLLDMLDEARPRPLMIIEAAGHCSTSRFWRMTIGEGWSAEATLELAAARLLERVLAGKEESDDYI